MSFLSSGVPDSPTSTADLSDVEGFATPPVQQPERPLEPPVLGPRAPQADAETLGPVPVLPGGPPSPQGAEPVLVVPGGPPSPQGAGPVHVVPGGPPSPQGAELNPLPQDGEGMGPMFGRAVRLAQRAWRNSDGDPGTSGRLGPLGPPLAGPHNLPCGMDQPQPQDGLPLNYLEYSRLRANVEPSVPDVESETHVEPNVPDIVADPLDENVASNVPEGVYPGVWRVLGFLKPIVEDG